MTARLAVEFVINAGAAIGETRRYSGIGTVDPAAFLGWMAARNIFRLAGGFCVVVDGVVWNAVRPAPYDPLAVDCIADRVTDALVFLESVADQAEGGHAGPTYFTETFTVEFRRGGEGELRLTGTANHGPVRAPDISVAAADFHRALSGAAFQFAAFGRRLAAEVRSGFIPLPREGRKELEERLMIERWEIAAERLRRVAAGETAP